jgi:hypothetical protein
VIQQGGDMFTPGRPLDGEDAQRPALDLGTAARAVRFRAAGTSASEDSQKVRPASQATSR